MSYCSITIKLSAFAAKLMAGLQSITGFATVLAISLMLVIISYFTSNPITSMPVESQLGLLNIIPLEYCIAIFLSLALMVSNIWNKRKPFFFASMLLFIFIFINIESVFLYNPVGSTDAFGHFLRGATLDDSSNPFVTTAGYPYGYFGSFLFTKIACVFLGLQGSDVMPALTIFRMALPLLFFSLMYYVLLRFMSAERARAIMVIMVISIPYFQFHYSPQAFGLILLPLFIITMISQHQNPGKYYAAQIAIFALLMFTHGPTTFYLALTYFFSVAMCAILRRKRYAVGKINACFGLSLVFLAGSIFANPIIFKLIDNILAEFNIVLFTTSGASALNLRNVFAFDSLNPTEYLGALGLDRLGGNYMVPESIRLLVLGVACAVYAWGSYVVIKQRRFDAYNIFLIGGFASVLLLFAGNFLFASLNLVDRAFLFMEFGAVLMLRNLLPTNYSLLANIKSLKNAPRKATISLFLVFVMVLPAFNGLAYYYNVGINFTAPQNEDRNLFLMQHSGQMVVFSHRDNHGLTLPRYSFEERIYRGKIYFSLNHFAPGGEKNYTDACVVISEATVWAYWLQDEDDALSNLMSYCDGCMNKVYSSPGNIIWRN